MKFIIKDRTLVWKMSFEEFIIEMSKKIPDDFDHRSSARDGDYDWNSFKSFNEFIDFLRSNKINNKYDLFEESEGTYQKKVKSYAGNRISVPAHVSGSNRSFLKTEKMAFKRKPKLFVDIAKNGAQSLNVFESQEETMLKLHKENLFKDIDLVFIESAKYQIDIPEFDKIVKCIDFENNFGFMSNAQKISLANNADFFRRGGFKTSENLSLYYSIKNSDFSYGYGRAMEGEDVKEILYDAYSEPIHYLNNYYGEIEEEDFRAEIKKIEK
ncbi:hypothetical protein ACI1UM_06455 [Lactococcus petauri]|uniref:hypothetical protein n=1 Tax=Lactococcus petauri TaxID=1940789 RepID=UPI003854813A